MLGNALVKSVDRSDLDFNVLVEDDATSKGVASFFWPPHRLPISCKSNQSIERDHAKDHPSHNQR